MLATTCNLFAVAAVTFNISVACKTKGADNNSVVPLEDIDLVLNKLYTSEPFVSVRVIVSAFPESSDTSIDFTIAVVEAAQVYNVVTEFVVRSTFAFV
tara:strand:+ start:3001 stop:3294 length:294 start_codon:yes stop_codon:yes gene_type:complete